MELFQDNTAVMDCKKHFQLLLQNADDDRSREARLDHGEQSLKRARLEFETEVEASKQQHQKRQLWENVECKQQLDRVLMREETTRDELVQRQEKLLKMKSDYEQRMLTAQRRHAEEEMEREETEQSLKADIAELTEERLRRETDVNNLECEVEEARQQTQLALRKCGVAEDQVEQLAACQSQLVQEQIRVKELESQVSQLTNDGSIGRNVKSCLVKLPQLEKDNTQLTEENKCLRETQVNTALLREQVISLESKLNRSEKRQKGCDNWRILHDALKEKCAAWECEDTNGKKTLLSPREFKEQIAGLQRSNVLLMEKQGHLQGSLHSTEETLRMTDDKLTTLHEDFVKEQNASRHHEEFIKRLQRKLLFVTKERDGFKQIMDSYASEVTMTVPRLPQPKQGDKSTELRQIASLETELASCREQLLPAETRCQLLETQLLKLKQNQATNVSYTSEADQNIILSLRETVASLELKLESLGQEKDRLELMNERRLLQGDYDPTKTKVIHLSMNPAAFARQRQATELARLTAEVDQLKLRLQEKHSENEPHSEKQPHSDERTTPEPSTSKEISDFKAQLTSAELKNKRLMEAFKKTSLQFRKVCYQLLGYRIDLLSDNQFKLQNMYAESAEDVLLFQETDAGAMQILENAFSASLSDKVATYLQGADSIPAFLSGVTLELFSRQTMCVAPE